MGRGTSISSKVSVSTLPVQDGIVIGSAQAVGGFSQGFGMIKGILFKRTKNAVLFINRNNPEGRLGTLTISRKDTTAQKVSSLIRVIRVIRGKKVLKGTS
jgi:hypothetical protein